MAGRGRSPRPSSGPTIFSSAQAIRKLFPAVRGLTQQKPDHGGRYVVQVQTCHGGTQLVTGRGLIPTARVLHGGINASGGHGGCDANVEKGWRVVTCSELGGGTSIERVFRQKIFNELRHGGCNELAGVFLGFHIFSNHIEFPPGVSYGVESSPSAPRSTSRTPPDGRGPAPIRKTEALNKLAHAFTMKDEVGQLQYSRSSKIIHRIVWLR